MVYSSRKLLLLDEESCRRIVSPRRASADERPPLADLTVPGTSIDTSIPATSKIPLSRRSSRFATQVIGYHRLIIDCAKIVAVALSRKKRLITPVGRDDDGEISNSIDLAQLLLLTVTPSRRRSLNGIVPDFLRAARDARNSHREAARAQLRALRIVLLFMSL